MKPRDRPLSALVVDDSPSMRQQLCYALQRSLGVRPVEAVDGADGWRKLATGRFHIVITDVNMPVMDGLKLISLCRTAGPDRRVPIIVITTEGSEADRDRALGLGATAYLVKPVRMHQVVEAVKALLGMR